MPLRLDIRRKLSSRSDRVKSVDLHPSEPWMLVSLYNGAVHIWDYETQTMIKSFEVSELPSRCAKFIHRKNWVIAAADDMHIRVFNYNTLEKVATFEAHSDYIRCLAIHPSQPYVLSSSDDMLIKLWDWEKNWSCTQVYEGHSHYVMMVKFNPKDTNTFASACLDRTIKVWQLGSSVANFTLEGHEKGVNCVDYFQGGDKPYLISGADDKLAKIWDYQSKTCVQTLDGHTQNISIACFHPELPVILTGSEDGTVRIWHASTYRLENTLNYGLERVWSLAYLRGSNNVAIGYDEGSIMIKLGREEPVMSMDGSGKIIFSRHNEIQQANVKTVVDQEFKDGERLPLATKELGSCEVFPQSLLHNPNGRFVCVCGDGEYIIYTALAWRNKSFGQALEFVWAADAGEYAVRESSSKIKIFKNFKEKRTLKRDFSAEAIFGGALLGVKSSSSLCFYEWESGELIRRIDIVPKHVCWNDTGDLVGIVTEDSYFILRYQAEVAKAALDSKAEISDEGIEDTFDLLGEIAESVKTCCFVGETFLYTNSLNRLNYYIGGEVATISHLDRPMYMLGYIPKDNRIYLADKDLNIVSYRLEVSVLEYQTAIMRQDLATADAILPTVPESQRNRVARFLEKQGFQEKALEVSVDSEHKFELAISLGNLQVAHTIALESESDHKWKVLSDRALENWKFDLAEESEKNANDLAGLFLLYSCAGNVQKLSDLAQTAESQGKNNIAFLCHFVLGNLHECIRLLCSTSRFTEAAFFARTFCPSRTSEVVGLWKANLATSNKKASDSLADPAEYENLFPEFAEALEKEKNLYGSICSDSFQSPSDAVSEMTSQFKETLFHSSQSPPHRVSNISSDGGISPSSGSRKASGPYSSPPFENTRVSHGPAHLSPDREQAKSGAFLDTFQHEEPPTASHSNPLHHPVSENLIDLYEPQHGKRDPKVSAVSDDFDIDAELKAFGKTGDGDDASGFDNFNDTDEDIFQDGVEEFS
eukprot:Sdes_comp19433_c0_seq1m10814